MTAIDKTAPAGFRLRGWHVAAGVSVFFAVVIGVDTTFTVLALRTHPGEVSVTPYEDGLLYNRRIDQLKAQSRLGWRASAAAEPGVVVFQVRDRSGAPVRGLAIAGQLERPATEAGRIALRFSEAAPGRYEATAPARAGAWDATIEARRGDGAAFTAERRLTWP